MASSFGPVAAPSTRPGSPNSMAEARRLRRAPAAALLRSPPSRDYLQCQRCVSALRSRAVRRANQKRGNHRVPAASADLGTLVKGPGTRLRNPALKHTEERAARIRLPAEAERGADARFGISQAALATHGPLPRRRRLRPALL